MAKLLALFFVAIIDECQGQLQGQLQFQGAASTEQAFGVGDRVLLRNSLLHGEWHHGSVTSTGPVKVFMDSWKDAYEWNVLLAIFDEWVLAERAQVAENQMASDPIENKGQLQGQSQLEGPASTAEKGQLQGPASTTEQDQLQGELQGQGPASTTEQAFGVGDRVRLRNSLFHGDWQHGSVTSIGPVKVFMDSWNDAYEWNVLLAIFNEWEFMEHAQVAENPKADDPIEINGQLQGQLQLEGPASVTKQMTVGDTVRIMKTLDMKTLVAPWVMSVVAVVLAAMLLLCLNRHRITKRVGSDTRPRTQEAFVFETPGAGSRKRTAKFSEELTSEKKRKTVDRDIKDKDKKE